MVDVVWRGQGRGGGGGARGRGGRAKAGAEVAGGRGRGGPDVDPLLYNPYLAFEHESEAYHRCDKFRRMEIDGHAAVDWTTLEEVDEAARARDFIGHDTPWDRLFHQAYLPSFRVMGSASSLRLSSSLQGLQTNQRSLTTPRSHG
ncbi:hypothetical protein HanPI659440_Chr03g0103341 [Helianthus annuus]|nr:hypothetical protein HanPI659440_Chr03g0103341 [Helianthus annuus]